jgi:hypothetical protein
VGSSLFHPNAVAYSGRVTRHVCRHECLVPFAIADAAKRSYYRQAWSGRRRRLLPRSSSINNSIINSIINSTSGRLQYLYIEYGTAHAGRRAQIKEAREHSCEDFLGMKPGICSLFASHQSAKSAKSGELADYHTVQRGTMSQKGARLRASCIRYEACPIKLFSR